MLFNSYQFIFAFFPGVLALYFFSARFGRRARLGLLLAASLVFYSCWDVRFVSLLILSMAGNFLLGRLLTRAVAGKEVNTARAWLLVGITSNLAVLAAFKYANFFAVNFDLLTGAQLSFGNIILPLGISFFTFEQISYLVDIKRGHLYPSDPLTYAVFVSFFPRLVAGPILRYSQIEPQLAPGTSSRVSLDDLAVGLTIFFIGLCKKAFLADAVAQYVPPGFAAAQQGDVEFFIAWGSVLAYTCELYFDFSGYSDMAIGAARCFGIAFPLNFASPYKSTSITEFWRRWHITLSLFLRDYLYIPMGGSRRGKWRRYSNLMVTMLLGGLWHGANWTFVCWGGLHGFYLMVNHGWTAIGSRWHIFRRIREAAVWPFASWLMTFLAVVIGWVFFRSPDFSSALRILRGMTGSNGAVLPNAFLFVPGEIRHALEYVGISFGQASGSLFISTYAWVFALLFVALLMPNTQELLARFKPALASPGLARTEQWLYGKWSFRPAWGIAFGGLIFVGIISIVRVSEFLYWQF